MYPKSIKDYLTNTKLNSKTSRSGNLNKPFTEFCSFCETHGLSLVNSELMQYSISTIKLCILNDLATPKCHCGKPTGYTHTLSSLGRWTTTRCSIKCRSESLEYKDALSKSKLLVYSDPIRKEEVENKKSNTLMKNYGVRHPMQNIDLFNKQQSNCFKKDVNGLHGYEPHVYPILHEMYSDLVLGTAFLKENNLKIEWKGDDSKIHRSYPDFYSQKLNAFIEIKSPYTRKLHDNKLMKCRYALSSLGFGYFIITYTIKKGMQVESFNLHHVSE